MAAVQDFLGVGQAALFSFQLLQLSLSKIQLIQFLHLVAEQLKTGAQFFGIVSDAEVFLSLSLPVTKRLAHLTRQSGLPPQLIQQSAVGVPVQQGLMLVLTV